MRSIIIAAIILITAVSAYSWGSKWGSDRFGGRQFGVGKWGSSGGEVADTYWNTPMTDRWDTAMTALWDTPMDTEIP